jgi:hypothetical protein
MSEEARLHRKTRMLLYVIALLHLVCLGLMHRSAPKPTYAASQFAMRSVASDGSSATRL